MKPYAIKPSPLTGKELLVVTACPAAIKLLRALGGRESAVGFYLKPYRVRYFEALYEAGAVSVQRGFYRFPDGARRDVYQSAKFLRSTGRRIAA